MPEPVPPPVVVPFPFPNPFSMFVCPFPWPSCQVALPYPQAVSVPASKNSPVRTLWVGLGLGLWLWLGLRAHMLATIINHDVSALTHLPDRQQQRRRPLRRRLRTIVMKTFSKPSDWRLPRRDEETTRTRVGRTAGPWTTTRRWTMKSRDEQFEGKYFHNATTTQPTRRTFTCKYWPTIYELLATVMDRLIVAEN